MTNWTEKQLAEHLNRKGIPGSANTADVSKPPFKLDSKAAQFALGRLPTGVMNKTEAAYCQHLENLKHAGEVIWYKFEGIKLRLADNTFYTPDFSVMMADGTICLHETKGWFQDKAKIKIKVAASLYPFEFFVIRAKSKKAGGGWSVEKV